MPLFSGLPVQLSPWYFLVANLRSKNKDLTVFSSGCRLWNYQSRRLHRLGWFFPTSFGDEVLDSGYYVWNPFDLWNGCGHFYLNFEYPSIYLAVVVILFV